MRVPRNCDILRLSALAECCLAKKKLCLGFWENKEKRKAAVNVLYSLCCCVLSFEYYFGIEYIYFEEIQKAGVNRLFLLKHQHCIIIIIWLLHNNTTTKKEQPVIMIMNEKRNKEKEKKAKKEGENAHAFQTQSCIIIVIGSNAFLEGVSGYFLLDSNGDDGSCMQQHYYFCYCCWCTIIIFATTCLIEPD